MKAPWSPGAADSRYIDMAARRAVRYLITRNAFARSVVGVVHLDGAVHVRYETALGAGAIHLARQSKTALPSSELRPLAVRRQLMLGMALLIFLAGVAYLAYYVSRHRWFLQYGLQATAALGALALVLMPMLTAAVIGHFALPIRARRPLQPLMWIGLAATSCGLVAAGSVAGQPSTDEAASALQRGDVARAYLTAVAVHDLGVGAPSVAATIADDAHLQIAKDERSVVRLSIRVQERWYEPTKQQEVLEMLRQRAEDEAKVAFRKRDAPTIDALAAATKPVPETARTLTALAASLRADVCLAGRDYRCAAQQARQAAALAPADQEVAATLARTQSTLAANRSAALDAVRKAKRLQERRQAIAGALEATRQVELLASASPGPSSRELGEQLTKLNTEIARAEQREREQAEARESRRMRSRLMAPLRCRDGSLSPSCICGGSRRGCCSHHGGVAGCSVD